jgi:predicted nucleic acid-binding protein
VTWIVDTCVVIDVLEGDPEFGRPSAQLLDKMAGEGLALCPVSYIELAPAFLGDGHRQNEFLAGIGIQFSIPWDWKDTQHAHKAWERYVSQRRDRRIPRRPVADILIGSFAAGRKGLLTRNPDDFSAVFPSLTVIAPEP